MMSELAPSEHHKSLEARLKEQLKQQLRLVKATTKVYNEAQQLQHRSNSAWDAYAGKYEECEAAGLSPADLIEEGLPVPVKNDQAPRTRRRKPRHQATPEATADTRSDDVGAMWQGTEQ